MTQVQHQRYGWLVVGAATALTFLFGIYLSFGVFLDPLIKQFGWSSSLTSFIFSIYSASYSFSMIMMGRLADRYGSRVTIGFGGFITVLALVLSSRADAVWQLYLTFGVAGGIGAATFWIPPTKAVVEYFSSSENVNLAVSIMATGTGAGMLLISPLAGFFIVEYGWRMCYLLFGLISALICGLAVLVVKNPRRSARAEAQEESSSPGKGPFEALRSGNFWSLFGVNMLGSGIARNTVVVYLVVFLIAAGFPPQTGATCLGLVGGGTIIGRITSGFLSKKLRESRIVSVCYIIQGLSIFAFLLSGNIWSVYSSALVLGIAYGGYVPQYPIITRESFGMRSYGVIYGMIFSGYGVGGLFGPPILGGYLSSVVGNYVATFVICGILAVVAGVIALRIKSTDPELHEKTAVANIQPNSD